MSDGPSSDRLAALRERWQADPTSRLFLQVAEEHRSQGQSREALAVLDAGLKHHPGYFAALVAKGRCHLELGEATAAREALERAVRLDAMNGVASKLLVRAHLAAGEVERARERLDLYGLLYDGDPEIAELRRAISGQGAGPAPAEPFDAGDLPEALPPIDDVEGTENDDGVFDLAAAAAAPDPELVPPEAALQEKTPSPAPAPQPEAPASASAAVSVAGEGEPFADLVSAADARRYLEGLTAEGIFAIELPPAPPAVAAPEPEPAGAFTFEPAEAAPEATPAVPAPLPEISAAPAAPAALAPVAEPLPAPSEALDATPVSAPAEPGAEELFPLAAAPAPVASWEGDDIFGLGGPTPVRDPGGEVFTFPERQPPSPALPAAAATPWWAVPAPAEEPPAAAPPSAVALVEEDTLSLAPPPPAPAAPAAPRRTDETSATVTLGELYLRQGHVEEAVRIFREVLRRDPGNTGAREALERLEGAPARPLAAADLLAGYAGPDEPRARKIHLLGGYLKRLRGRIEGSRPDVP